MVISYAKTLNNSNAYKPEQSEDTWWINTGRRSAFAQWKHHMYEPSNTFAENSHVCECSYIVQIKNGCRHSKVYLLFWHWAPVAAAGHRQLKPSKLLDMQIPPFKHVLPNELRASSQLQAVWGAAAVHINSKSPGRCWVQEPCTKLKNVFTINIEMRQWETEAQYKIIEIIAVTDYKILNWDDTQTTDRNPVLCYSITRREPKSVWWWRTGWNKR